MKLELINDLSNPNVYQRYDFSYVAVRLEPGIRDTLARLSICVRFGGEVLVDTRWDLTPPRLDDEAVKYTPTTSPLEKAPDLIAAFAEGRPVCTAIDAGANILDCVKRALPDRNEPSYELSVECTAVSASGDQDTASAAVMVENAWFGK